MRAIEGVNHRGSRSGNSTLVELPSAQGLHHHDRARGSITPRFTLPMPARKDVYSLASLAVEMPVLAPADRMSAGFAVPAIVLRSPRAEVLVLLFALWLGVAHAETLTGKVIKVADGDTITILSGEQAHRVRLSGIDAPEKGQPYGNLSRQNLNRLVHGKAATADCHKVDRYQRKVCKVMVQPLDCPTCGHTLDVGLAQITAGLAWWYREYAREQAEEDRGRYESGQQEARLRRLGLWADDNRIPPWEWRQAKPTTTRRGTATM